MTHNRRVLREAPKRDREFESPQVRVRARTFEFPLVRDVAVVGRTAPVQAEVLRDVLRMMSREEFVFATLRDDTIAAILVRASVLRKIGWERVRRLVLHDVRKVMTRSEIITLKLEIEISLGESSFP